jgi:hypothetical protein
MNYEEAVAYIDEIYKEEQSGSHKGMSEKTW